MQILYSLLLGYFLSGLEDLFGMPVVVGEKSCLIADLFVLHGCLQNWRVARRWPKNI